MTSTAVDASQIDIDTNLRLSLAALPAHMRIKASRDSTDTWNRKMNSEKNLCHKETSSAACSSDSNVQQGKALFSNIAELQSQLWARRELQAFGRHSCQLCHTDWKSRSALSSHERQSHGIQYVVESACDSSDSAEQSYVNADIGFSICYRCQLCDGKYPDIGALVKHSAIDCKEKCLQSQNCFVCSICDSAYRSRDSLLEHVRGIHQNRMYSCSCGKSFRWRTSLKTHKEKCYFAMTGGKQICPRKATVANMLWATGYSESLEIEQRLLFPLSGLNPLEN